MAAMAPAKMSQDGLALVYLLLAPLCVEMVKSSAPKNAMMATLSAMTVVTRLARSNLGGNALKVKIASQCVVMVSFQALRHVMMETRAATMDAIAHVRRRLAGLAQVHPLFAHPTAEMVWFLETRNATMATRTAEMAVTASARLKPVGSALLVPVVLQFVAMA
jgi:hypothetical protein